MDNTDLDKAVAVLRRGGLVAFPTETVYGLGVDASNPDAIRKLYAAKGRPGDHPVIVHLADVAQLAQWTSEVTDAAQKLARKFWPGPLTLILRRAHAVSDLITGGQDTVGLRLPAHPVARALLARFGAGIAAPSANRFGRVSATTVQHVRAEFGDTIDLVLDGGQSEVGIESTIIDVSGERPVLLRPGHITAREIEAALGVPLAAARADAPRAPGTLAAHYAPRTPLMVLAREQLIERGAALNAQGKRIAALVLGDLSEEGMKLIAASSDADAYAHDFYANLRELDAADYDVILVERPPQTAAWAAVNDRLGRAAAGSPYGAV